MFLHRVGLAALAASAALPLMAVGGSEAAAPTATASSADLAITTGKAVGGVRKAESYLPLTFLFTARNKGPAETDPTLVVHMSRNADPNSESVTCITAAHRAFNGDGEFCEPGSVAAGASVGSNVATASIALNATPGSVLRVRGCVYDLNGVGDPRPGNNCRTVRVTVE